MKPFIAIRQMHILQTCFRNESHLKGLIVFQMYRLNLSLLSRFLSLSLSSHSLISAAGTQCDHVMGSRAQEELVCNGGPNANLIEKAPLLRVRDGRDRRFYCCTHTQTDKTQEALGNSGKGCISTASRGS